MSFITRLEDGRYMNVTKSISDHPDFRPTKGDVRMTANIAGLIIGPHPTNNKMCRCIQIVDGDLGGWLPASVVSMVTTQAFPISMRRANSKMKKVQNHKTVSELIEQSEGRGSGVVAKVGQKPVQQKTALSEILKMLYKYQPFMVFLILVTVIFRRR
jgi:sulfur carrier protein ThiS